MQEKRAGQSTDAAGQPAAIVPAHHDDLLHAACIASAGSNLLSHACDTGKATGAGANVLQLGILTILTFALELMLERGVLVCLARLFVDFVRGGSSQKETKPD